MEFQVAAYRNKKDVVSKFLTGFLLPSLGYAPGKIPEDVRIADFRLDLLVFLRWLIPVSEKAIRKTDIVVLPVRPEEKLEKHVRKISRYLTVLGARHGLLTNGGELRVYESFPGDSVELVFQCLAEEIDTRAADLGRIFRAPIHEKMITAESGDDEDLSGEAGKAAEMEHVRDSFPDGAISEEEIAEVLSEETEERLDDTPSSALEASVDGVTHEKSDVAEDETAESEEIEPKGELAHSEEKASDAERLSPSAEEVEIIPPQSEESTILISQPAAAAEDVSRMKVMAVYHNKGGVGKTTIAVNLAAALRKKGHRILLIDMDAQANATFAAGLIKFQFEEEDDIIQRYVYHLLESGDSNFIPDLVRRSRSFNTPEIDVVPSHIDLIVHQDTLTQIAVSRSRLMTKLRRIETDYDFVIIDTPPSRDLYAEIPLIAADYLIVPSDLRPFANQGLKNVRNFVDQVNEYRESIARDPLVVLGVLPSKIPTNSQYLKYTFPRQKQTIPERYGFALMESVIYDRMPLSTALSRVRKDGDAETPDPKSIFEFCAMEGSSSAGQSADDFEALADEILTKTL